MSAADPRRRPREAPITSPSNPRLRAAAALRERRERDRRGRILVDGAREIARAIEAGLAIEAAFVPAAAADGDAPAETLALLVVLEARGAALVPVAPGAMRRLAFGDREAEPVAVAVPPPADLGSLTLPADALVVVLEGVEKPGNVGAVVRSADGAGASAVIIAGGPADPWNPNAIRSSLGTVLTMPVAVGASEQVLAWLRGAGVRLFAARVDGSRPYTEANLTGRAALVLGSEAHGLTDAWRGPDVTAIRLPMLGRADSLNIAAAAAILLYEARRQREGARAIGPAPRPGRGAGAGGTRRP